MTSYLKRFPLRKTEVLRERAGEGSGANPFSATATAGSIVAKGCHECECEAVFAEVMERVLRVKNMCSDDVCRVENFQAFRRRNLAISADYARIYLQPLGEAKRLKFAAGAAFGSTHIGYGLDLAAETLAGWGNRAVPERADLLLPNGSGVGPDRDPWPVDPQELGSWLLTGVTYAETLTGLRRLVYGNLAIYMDLGALLWFCQLHEQRFGFFKAGRVDDFMGCFERFKAYVMSHHGADHPVYGANGSFGASDEGWLRNGLRSIAENNISESLSLIDHEQRVILEQFMYRPRMVPQADREDLGTDDEFRRFMNALENVNWGNGYGQDGRFQGMRAIFSALEDPFLLSDAIQMHGDWQMRPLPEQPLVYLFDGDRYGNDFTDPDVRTPWFKDVVRHFIRAEQNDFNWPSGEGLPPLRRMVFGRGYGADIREGTPNLTNIILSDLAHIRSMG